MLTAVIGAAVLALWGAMAWRDRSRRLSAGSTAAELPAMTDEEEQRLQAIADVPIEDIIAAAEWHAQHPDEPLPQILADLDPETRQTVTPMPAGVSTAFVTMPPIDVAGVMERFAKGVADRGVMVVPDDGLEYRVKGVVSGACAGVPASASRYADCNHPDASHVEVMSPASETPLKTFVTGCGQCDDLVLLQELTDECERMSGLIQSDDGVPTYDCDLVDHFEHRVGELDKVRRRVGRAADEQRSRDYAQATHESLRTESSST